MCSSNGTSESDKRRSSRSRREPQRNLTQHQQSSLNQGQSQHLLSLLHPRQSPFLLPLLSALPVSDVHLASLVTEGVDVVSDGDVTQAAAFF